jgi:hypothetical protein
MSESKLTLRLLKEKYGVCRLDKTSSIPEWAMVSDFFSITKTYDELSIVCVEASIPEGIKCEKDWRILKVEGQLDFSLIGILSEISTILAQNKISIFAISTYDTDYILIKDKDAQDAVTALMHKEYEVLT